MPVELLGALVVAKIGSPIQLSVDARPLVGAVGTLVPAPGSLPEDPEARESRQRARLHVSHVVGLPENTEFYWSMTPMAARPLAAIYGPSLYGAYCLSLMQAVVLYFPQAVRSLFRSHAPTVQDTRLNRIAISAAFHEDGGFDGVGMIDEKLTQLATLGTDVCSLCIVARRQGTIGLSPVSPVSGSHSVQTPDFIVYQTPNGPNIAVIHADDPLDAYGKLFRMQSRNGSLLALRAAP